MSKAIGKAEKGLMSLFTRMFYKEGPGVSDEPPQKGFALFWWIIKSNNTDLVLLNWLFILCCLPVITIGPALKALSKVTLNLVRQEPMSFFSEFFHELKENFIKCSLLGLCYLGAIAISLFCTYFYLHAANGNLLIYFFAAVSFIILHLIIASMMFVFGSIAITTISIRDAVRNSLRLIFVSPKELALIFVSVCVPVYIFLINDLFGLIGVTFFTMFLFTVDSIITSFFSWRVLKKHVVH